MSRCGLCGLPPGPPHTEDGKEIEMRHAFKAKEETMENDISIHGYKPASAGTVLTKWEKFADPVYAQSYVEQLHEDMKGVCDDVLALRAEVEQLRRNNTDALDSMIEEAVREEGRCHDITKGRMQMLETELSNANDAFAVVNARADKAEARVAEMEKALREIADPDNASLPSKWWMRKLAAAALAGREEGDINATR